jgi:hypothetical protein
MKVPLVQPVGARDPQAPGARQTSRTGAGSGDARAGNVLKQRELVDDHSVMNLATADDVTGPATADDVDVSASAQPGSEEPRRPLAPSVTAGCLAVLVSVVFLVVASQGKTPTHDDFYTLEFARQPTLGAVLDLHAHSFNSTAPPPYIMAWGWAQVAGTSFSSVVALSIAGWAALTGLLAWMLRRLGPIAVLVGALFPTLTSLAYLGTAARAYSVVLALLAAATVLSGVSGSVCRSVTRHVGLFGVVWFACLLHYPSALYAVFLIMAVGLEARRDRRQLTVVATMAAAVACATIPQLAFAQDARAYSAVLPPAGTRAWSGVLVQLSLLRTWWPLLAGLVVLIVPTWNQWRRAVERPRRSPPLTFCVVTAILFPLLVALPFAAMGAAFYFRYAAPVLIVTSLLVGLSIDSLPMSQRTIVLVLAPALLLCVLASHHHLRALTPSDQKVTAMQDELGLSLISTEQIYVTEERTFTLLKEYGENPDRFHLCSDSATPIARGSRRCPTEGRDRYVVMTTFEWNEGPAAPRSGRELGTTSFTSNDRTVSVTLVELA